MQVGPSIRRLGANSIVNAYLVEDGGGVTVVDAGVPGYYSDIPRELAAMGRSVSDVRALVLTQMAVVLINVFEVPEGRDEEFLSGWRATADWLVAILSA